MGIFKTAKRIFITNKAFNDVFKKPDMSIIVPSWFNDESKCNDFLSIIKLTLVDVNPLLGLYINNFSPKTLKAIFYSAAKLEKAGFSEDDILVSIEYYLNERIKEYGIDKFIS